VNKKNGRKESLFPKEATHKGWKSPLLQPRVLESLKNLGESLSLIDRKDNLWTKLNLFSLIKIV